MFKKLFNYLPMLAMASAVALSGCGDDDQPAPAVTQENEVPNGTAVITYSVQVLGSSENNAKATGLAGATVTVSHPGGTSTTTTNESGIAVFPGMRIGDVSVYVESDGFLAFNFSDNVSCDWCAFDYVDSEQQEFDQATVTLPRLGATLRGTIYGDFDFDGMTNNTTIPAGATVIAEVDNSFQPNVFTTTTDGQGNFSFTNLPENVAVNLILNHQSMDNSVSPAVEEDWSIPAGPYVLDVNNPRALGQVPAFY